DEYILEGNLRGCRVIDTIQINSMPIPDIDLGNDGDICEDETIVLHASYRNRSSYLWNTGDTTETISVTSAGLYSVVVTSEYKCVGADTIQLAFHPKPVVSLPVDTAVCEETPLLI